MECCGTPFKKGEIVKWLVHKADKMASCNFSIDIGHVDYYYEAHESDYKSLYMIEGVVSAIKALHQEYRPSKDNPQLYVPVRGVLVDVDSSDVWSESVDNMDFRSYVVQLDNYSIRPAKKQEVTFN